jgi:hypothetical protein
MALRESLSGGQTIKPMSKVPTSLARHPTGGISESLRGTSMAPEAVPERKQYRVGSAVEQIVDGAALSPTRKLDNCASTETTRWHPL